MRYMGGKTKIARHVVAAILADADKRDRWFEPFVGGGAVMQHAAPHFDQCVGSDIHLDLIMMWEHVTSGGMIPDYISPEEYQKLKRADPSWLRGFAGFGASFGGRWFGGYGKSVRDGEVCRESYRSVNKQAAVFTENRVRFVHGSYDRFTPPAGTVIYCDPPYAGTTFYSKTPLMDYEHFYTKIRTWARTSDVYLSEYAIPADVPSRLIWERQKRVSLKVDDNTRLATERLFKILP